MLRVTIELLLGGNESRKRHMGTAEISLVETSEDAQEGNYKVMLSKWGRPKQAWKQGSVKGFPRKALGPWDLLFWALTATVGQRSLRYLEKERSQQ